MAATYVVVLVWVRGVPDLAVALFGGPNGGVARHGGLALRYRLPERYDEAALERSIANRNAVVTRDGPVLSVEIPGPAQPDAERTADILTQGGLEFREALEDTSLQTVRAQHIGHNMYVAPGVRIEVDEWRPSDGSQHTALFLQAERREQLERAFVEIRTKGWVQPPHTVLAYEQREDTPGRVEWRSYLLSDQVALDGNAIARAVRSTDPNTGHTVVLLDFDPVGARQFAALTERIVGHKLATLLGGRVMNAPYIDVPIPGGHASIRMGSGDPVHEERAADALMAVLSAVPLPPGGEVEARRWVAPAQIAAVTVLGALATALAAGLLIGLIAWLAVRITRPVWQPRPVRRSGKLPVRRILVTLLAPVSLIVLSNVPVPGINDVELSHILAHTSHLIPATHIATLAALGITPIVSAFIVVELAMLLTARGRRARHDPRSRIAIGRWVAFVGVVLALGQSYFIVGWLKLLAPLNVELVEPGSATRLVIMLSMTTGTLLLAVVAGMIREHGLGNGYGALILSDWVLDHALGTLAGPSPGTGPGLALGALTFAWIAIATMALLRMRVAPEREAALRVPSCGSAPVVIAGGLIAQIRVVGLAGLAAFSGLADWLHGAQDQTWLYAAVVVGLVLLWSFVFSWVDGAAALASRSTLAPPSWATWQRATLLSLVVLLTATIAERVAAHIAGEAGVLCDAGKAMLAAALALDMLDDLRARRGDMVAIWPLNDALHAELVRRVLGEAGIDCHLQSSHLRTLLALFGPYVPIDVHVPAAAADDARERIAALFRDPAIPAAAQPASTATA